MNLEKLFKMQKELDERILDRFPELRNEDLLDKKILSLQVELGELAQNWRGFKFWSEDQEPNTEVSTGICIYCGGTGNTFFDDYEKEWEDCPSCDNGETNKNPLLEEYVDCLHFILSIGNDLGLGVPSVASIKTRVAFKGDEVTIQFNALFKNVGDLGNDTSRNDITGLCYRNTLYNFVGLGEMLGFTWNQIEQAYYDKNKVNHERQNNGY